MPLTRGEDVPGALPRLEELAEAEGRLRGSISSGAPGGICPRRAFNLLPNRSARVRESRVRRRIWPSVSDWRSASVLLWWMFAALGLAATLPPRYRFQNPSVGADQGALPRRGGEAGAPDPGPRPRNPAASGGAVPGQDPQPRRRGRMTRATLQTAWPRPSPIPTSRFEPRRRMGRIRAPPSRGSGWWSPMNSPTSFTSSRRAGSMVLGRRLFGRAPFLFPNALQPAWFIEGLAVREETKGTAFGRGRHTFTKMVVDEAARSGQLERMDQATLGLDAWPLGNAPYLFGEEFLSFVEMNNDEGSGRDLALAHGASFRPYLDDRTFRQVTGRGLTPLWREFARTRLAGLRAGRRPARRVRAAVPDHPGRGPDRPSPLAGWIPPRLHQSDPRPPGRNPSDEQGRLVGSTSDLRVSGAALAWSPDGRFIVFDETDQVRKFESAIGPGPGRGQHRPAPPADRRRSGQRSGLRTSGGRGGRSRRLCSAPERSFGALLSCGAERSGASLVLAGDRVVSPAFFAARRRGWWRPGSREASPTWFSSIL